MPTDSTDVSKMPMPAGGNVNSPASGSYGEGAALERLKRDLPSTASPAPSAQNPTSPMPTPPVGAGVSNAPSPGVPAAILAPTSRPDVPVSTPLNPGALTPVQMSGAQRRIAILDTLANSPNVAESTREWAKLALEKAIAGSVR